MKNLITKFYFGPYVGRNRESRLINLTALFKGSYKLQTSRNFSQLIFYAGMRVSTLVLWFNFLYTRYRTTYNYVAIVQES